jgi:hypothetical protein
MLTEFTFHQLTAHIASQGHAMAGATIAASAALACSLGEACVRINAPLLPGGEAGRVAGRLAEIRDQLQALTDEDGAAITAFAALRAAGKTLEGQERLCQMPIEMAWLAIEAACLLQEFRPLIQVAQDDLEMAVTLLAGTTRAATLLLDSNLRIWPDPPLLARFEPELAWLKEQIEQVQPKL